MKTTDTAFNAAVDAETFDDIIFDGRNLKYGAYFLRKTYLKNVSLSLLVTVVVAIVISFLLYYRISHRPIVEIVQIPPTIVTIKPTDVIPIQFPRQPRIEIPNDAARVSNTGPMVVSDDPATNDPVPTQSELVEQPPENNADGIAGALIIAPSPSDRLVDENNVFNYREVTEQASFKHGTLDDFRIWLSKNISYSEDAVQNDISGTIVAKFTVGKDGKICDVIVEKGIHPIIDKAVLKALLSSPKWEPAKMNGRAVKVLYYVPVRFNIER
jgi:protein TonB